MHRYRLPVRSRIMAALEKISKEGVKEMDANDFLVNVADVNPHSYSINILKATAPRFGYTYESGRLRKR